MSHFNVEDPEDPQTGFDQVESIILPRTKDIGGFEVKRALPSSKRRMVAPFIFWDQMGPGEFITGKGVDVRPHPHIGLSTITYLFKGTLDHKDSLGTNMRIKPGDVNMMTAGSGIVHSERTGQDIRKNPSSLFGIQSWIALPKDKEENDCAFDHIAKNDLPIISDTDKTVRLISGTAYGQTSPLTMPSPAIYADIALNKGASIPIPADYEERALYVLTGRIHIGGVDYDPQQLLILKPDDTLTVKALDDVRMMLLGGESLDGRRYMYWNFVHSDKDRIEQAKKDWKENKFTPVPNDNDEFIPLPDDRNYL